MLGTDLKRHQSNQISIKDLSQDLDISAAKWDSIFDFLLFEADVVYFKGIELDYYDNDFQNNIEYASESILLDDHNYRILFKVKMSCVLLNRNLLSKVWNFYHFPCLIFLKDRTQEGELIKLVDQRAYLTEIVEELSEVNILYRDIESDVLWLLSSVDMPQLIAYP